MKRIFGKIRDRVRYSRRVRTYADFKQREDSGAGRINSDLAMRSPQHFRNVVGGGPGSL